MDQEIRGLRDDAYAYGQRMLETVRKAGLPKVTYEPTAPEVVKCIMKAGFREQYVGKSVHVECTEEEAFGLLLHPDIVAECAGSRYPSAVDGSMAKGFLSWYYFNGKLSLGIGACAKDNPIAHTTDPRAREYHERR